MRSTTVLPLLLLIAAGAAASDGVLEINQTCALQTGCFDGDAPGFPVTLGQPGSYRLTSNLTQTYIPGINSPEDAVKLDADGIHLDLAGFSISCVNPLTGGCGSGDADGIVAVGDAYEGLRVTNGVVQGMPGRGLHMQTAVGARVDGIQATENGDDGIFLGVEGSVTASTVRDNGGSGIVVYGGAYVAENTVTSNAFDGINVSSGSMVRANVVQDNGGNGIVATFGSAVLDNAVFDNGGIRSGVGLDLSVQVSYRGNTLTNNAAGGVSGGVNLGDNLCTGPNNGSTSCP
jgi:hypothetical protein